MTHAFDIHIYTCSPSEATVDSTHVCKVRVSSDVDRLSRPRAGEFIIYLEMDLQAQAFKNQSAA